MRFRSASRPDVGWLDARLTEIIFEDVSGPEIRQIGFIREPTGEIEDEDNE